MTAFPPPVCPAARNWEYALLFYSLPAFPMPYRDIVTITEKSAPGQWPGALFSLLQYYRAALMAAMAPSATAVATWRTCFTRMSPAA